MIEIDKFANQFTSFKARTVNIENMDECYLVIFYNIEEYLLFQRAYDFDEQDQQHGMNTYYIEYCDQSKSIYGEIESIVLERHKVNIELSSKAAMQLNINKKLSVSFKINDEAYEDLKKQMNNIFLEKECFRWKD